MGEANRRAGNVPVVLSNVIDAVMALIEQRPALQTRSEIMTFLQTVRNEAKGAEQVVREAQIPIVRPWSPPN